MEWLQFEGEGFGSLAWPFGQELVPVLAIVALLIFVALELRGWRRRRAAEQRKIEAIKLILARECELNWGPVSSVAEVFKQAPLIAQAEKLAHMPPLHRSLIAGLLFESASLQELLYARVSSAHDALSEVERIRDSLIRLHASGRVAGTEVPSTVLRQAEEALANLYRFCTGKELAPALALQ